MPQQFSNPSGGHTGTGEIIQGLINGGEGSLPLTGFDVSMLIVGAWIIICVGYMLRRMNRPR